MKIQYKVLSLVLLLPTLLIVFALGGTSLVEGYNVFDPYIDTWFSKEYTPSKFEAIEVGFSREEVIRLIGEPLFIRRDSVSGKIEFEYSSDGLLREKSHREHVINDFAWYRSRVCFDSVGKVIEIDKGWTYD